MRYIQFYHLSTGYIAGTTPPQFSPEHVKPIEVCGSDGVLYLDGRFGLRRCRAEGIFTCIKRGFVGFRIMQGESVLNAVSISGYIPVTEVTK